jgi:PPOX class probable F420-dependent enzyme
MQLTNKQHDFLNGVHFAVVSTIASDGMPHQTVMWYMLVGDELLLNTFYDSLKHKHLRRDPRLSVCVEDGYNYLTLTGTVALDEDAATARADYQRLGQRYAGTMNFTRPAPNSQSDSTPNPFTRERVTLHMTIDKVLSNRLSG